MGTQFDAINTLTFLWKCWLCASCLLLDPMSHHITMYIDEYFDCSSNTIFNSTWCSLSEYLIRNPSNAISEEIEYLCFQFERYPDFPALYVLYSWIRMTMTLSVYVAVLDCIDRLWKHTKNWKLPAIAFGVFLFNVALVYWNNQMVLASNQWLILHFIHHSTFNMLPIWIYYQIRAHKKGKNAKQKNEKEAPKQMLAHQLLSASMNSTMEPSMSQMLADNDTFRSLVGNDTFRSLTQQITDNDTFRSTTSPIIISPVHVVEKKKSTVQTEEYHPCNLLTQNAKLRKYDEFVKECKHNWTADGKIDKSGIAF